MSYPSHGVKHTRSTNDQAYARSTCQISICCGSIASGLFVAKRYELDAQGNGFLGDLDDRNSDQAKDDFDTEVMERLRNDLGARVMITVGHSDWEHAKLSTALNGRTPELELMPCVMSRSPATVLHWMMDPSAIDASAVADDGR